MKKIELDDDGKSKIVRNGLIVTVAILGILFVLKFIPLGEKDYYLDEERTIKGPKLSFVEKEECVKDYVLHYGVNSTRIDSDTLCINQITFHSLSSKMILELNRDNMLEDFDKKLCNNSHYLYDNGKYVLLTDFDIKKGFLFNTYSIQYIIGGFDNGNCLLIEDSEKVELLYDKSYKAKDGGEDVTSVSYQYLNKNGKTYDVHSDCGDCLIIKNGMGKGTSFKEMLSSSYIDMDTLIQSLEYRVKNNRTEKVVYEDGVMYKHDQIHLLYCNNQEVYISDKIDYTSKMCK